jgi:hypothetical protein
MTVSFEEIVLGVIVSLSVFVHVVVILFDGLGMWCLT